MPITGAVHPQAHDVTNRRTALPIPVFLHVPVTHKSRMLSTPPPPNIARLYVSVCEPVVDIGPLVFTECFPAKVVQDVLQLGEQECCYDKHDCVFQDIFTGRQ